MTLRIVQLSDIHLMESPDGRVMGVDTDESFRRVLAAVADEVPEPDLVVTSGDLGHDEGRPTYERLSALLREHGHRERCRLVPGNHDTPALLREVFADRYDDAPGGSACFGQRLGDWTVIGVDSHLPGELGGRVGAAQLAWLRERLAAAADSPTLVFLHHPPGFRVFELDGGAFTTRVVRVGEPLSPVPPI